MNIFVYKMDHDYGLAPNPFWGYITLAVCKSQIRRNPNLSIGDWIVGTGSKSMGNINKLIYAMKVEELITFDEYWNDERFQCKKPYLTGPLLVMYGDNIYHTDPNTNNVIQEASAHSSVQYKDQHSKSDVSGKYVPISKHFYYFGSNSPLIPQKFKKICPKSRNYHYLDISPTLQTEFIDWLETNYTLGIHGDPTSWSKYKLPKLEIYED